MSHSVYNSNYTTLSKLIAGTEMRNGGQEGEQRPGALEHTEFQNTGSSEVPSKKPW